MSAPLAARDHAAVPSEPVGSAPRSGPCDLTPELPAEQETAEERGGEIGERRSPMLREYEARRCHVCQARHPSFGFGPPLTRKGHTLWACGTHRDEVHGMLSRPLASPPQQEQRRLL